MYEWGIYTQTKSEKTGKLRSKRAGRGTSKAKSLTAAVDDVKAIVGKLPADKQAKISEVRIASVQPDSGEPQINL